MSTKTDDKPAKIEKQINIVRLRPRPRLPSEYSRQLQEGRDDLERTPVADLAERLDRLCEIISNDSKAIPITIDEEDEDSLVIRVEEALGSR